MSGIPGRSRRVHVVVAGDTLARIATKYYGDAKKWPAIYALPANKAQLGPNPNQIRPGLRCSFHEGRLSMPLLVCGGALMMCSFGRA